MNDLPEISNDPAGDIVHVVEVVLVEDARKLVQRNRSVLGGID